MSSVAIVGAGIAGLALAAALDRRGIASAVFEQAGDLAGIGAGVQLAPNASRLLHRLGLGARLGAVAVRPACTEFRRWADDSLIGRAPLGAECERRFGAPYYTLHRRDLRDALASLVPPGAIRLGARLVTVREEPARVVLGFADGSQRAAELAVGADGIGSVVRSALAGDAPVFAGLGVYRGLAPAAALPELAGPPAVRVWPGPGRHLVCYPVSAGQVISFAATVPCAVAGQESWTAEGSRQQLGLAFGGWNRTVRRLIAAAPEVRLWALYDRDPLTRLATSRVALVGDAAHPMLPFAAQGANQAVEDAVALAACLAARRGGPAGAGCRYDECRRARTTRLQRQARRDIGGLHLPDGEVQRSRDRALGLPGDLSRQDWLYGHDAERACLR